MDLIEHFRRENCTKKQGESTEYLAPFIRNCCLIELLSLFGYEIRLIRLMRLYYCNDGVSEHWRKNWSTEL